MSVRRRRIRALRAERPRDRFSRGSMAVGAVACVVVWLVGDPVGEGFWTPRRMENLRRFLFEAIPFPLQDPDLWSRPVDALRPAAQWIVERSATALPALGVTLALSVAAACWAALGGVALAFFGRRSTARPAFGTRWGAAAARGVATGLRALPEYLWAFFLVALLGPSVWPVVVALALHNAGILGRLGAETVDDLEPEALHALEELGAAPAQVFFAGAVPQVLGRWLLFFFYRWETCVREATVLGMLGIVSLGYWIEDARARRHLDDMVFLVGCAAILVIVGDWVSDRVRRSLQA